MKIILSSVFAMLFALQANGETLLVKVVEGKILQQTDLQQKGFKIISEIPQLNMLVVERLNSKSVVSVLEEMPSVKYVEDNNTSIKIDVPNDPEISNQYHHEVVGTFEAWDMISDLKEVVIAITDTGIDLDHPDLVDNFWQNTQEIPDNGIDDDENGYVDDVHGWNFYHGNTDIDDQHSHGTHVAGIAGARGNNEIGVAGIHPNVKLMTIRLFNKYGFSADPSEFIKGIIYAVDNGARAINASWGGGEYSEGMKEALEYANERGVLFITSAGNSGKNNDRGDYYPGNYEVENVIVVGSGRDKPNSFSNYGETTVDVFAPGANIYSTIPDGYGSKTGTSMASPVVAGLVGLIFSANSELTGAEAKQVLMESVVEMEGFKEQCVSNGRVSAPKAIELALQNEGEQ